METTIPRSALNNSSCSRSDGVMCALTWALRFSLMALLAGCAAQPQQQYGWRHDSGARDQAMLNRDEGSCRAQALAHPGMSIEQGMHIFGACMAGKGWSLVPR